MTKIVLLDIDGVLVHPGGYRAALRATMNHYFNLMGLASFDIPEEKLIELEKRGISSEWDMIPLLLASILVDILSDHPIQNLPSKLSSAAMEIGNHLTGHRLSGIEIPMFKLTANQYPAESALQQGCFLSIPIDLRTNLLVATRNIHLSETMRLFQHFTLGSEKFAQTYHLPAEIETVSLLLAEDKSNINDEIRAKLHQPGIYLSAFTARPSMPPRDVAASYLGYAPEAELALELVDLPDIPLIAFGKLQYLASQRGLDPVTLLKPSLAHALAAIVAAMTGDEWTSLQSVGDWYQTGKLKSILSKLPHSFELIIVEDTFGGIRSVQAAGEILQKAGLDIIIHPLGLALRKPAQSAFVQANVEYYENWDSLTIGIGL
jgi:hypothetical protein